MFRTEAKVKKDADHKECLGDHKYKTLDWGLEAWFDVLFFDLSGEARHSHRATMGIAAKESCNVLIYR